MALSDTTLYRQNMETYFTNYFGTKADTTEWQTAMATQSGLDSMIVDLEMMSRGISTHLNYLTATDRDFYNTLSGVEVTNTKDLANYLMDWAMVENTNYAAVVEAEIMRILAKREPVLQLKAYFPELSVEQCEILYLQHENYRLAPNLQDAHGQAVETRRLELETYDDINLEGETT